MEFFSRSGLEISLLGFIEGIKKTHTHTEVKPHSYYDGIVTSEKLRAYFKWQNPSK